MESKSLLFLILILSASCRPDVPDPEAKKELRTWEEVFTAWYDGMTRNYLFWESDFESLDWANLYDEYLPRFRSYGNFGGEHQTEGLFDLYEIRRMIECALMPRVVENINDVVISQCEVILAQWAFLVQKGEAVHEKDREFHDALYAPAGNNLLIGLCDIFWASFKQAEDNGLIVRYFPDNKEDALNILELHRQILNAVREKDVKKSSFLMYQHFRSLEIPENGK